MLRLVARREGAGMMVLSVPAGVKELADRVATESLLPGADRVAWKGGRWVFMVEPQVWSVCSDLRCIPLEVLRQDRAALTEVMSRIACSGWDLRALLREEFEYLQQGIGDGNWCRGIPYVA